MFLIILLIPWISFFPAPILIKYQLATKAFLLLAFILLLIKHKASIFKLHDLFLWIFLAAIGLNVIFAQQKNIALTTYLDLSIPMFCIYYLVSYGFSNEKNFTLLAKTICLSSIIVSLFAILESLFAFNPLYIYFIDNPYYQRYITGFSRPMSTQFTAPTLGAYLLGCLPFSFLLFKKNGSFFWLLGAMGIIFNIAIIILTFSRNSFLGLIAMIMFYLFMQKNYNQIITFFVILLTFIYLFSYLPYPFYKLGINGLIKDNLLYSHSLDKYAMAPPRIVDRPVAGIQNFDKFRIDWIIKDSLLSTYRLDRLNMSLRMIKDNPLTGVGFHHFRIRFYDYYPGKNKIPYEIMIADNMYLTLLAETGIIGFAGFLTFIFTLFKKVLKISNLFPKKRLYLLAGLMAFIGLLVNMAGNEFFYWPNQYLLFCIIVGCMNALLKKSDFETTGVLIYR